MRKQVQLNIRAPEEMRLLLKTTAAATGVSLEGALQLMALYFWELGDAEVKQRQKTAAAAVQAITKGKRPFSEAVA